MWPHRRQPARLPHPWDSPGKNTGVRCHFLLQCMKAKSEREVAQSCLTLCDPMDGSLPGSSVHGIFQTRVLEWGAIAFSSGFPYFLQFKSEFGKVISVCFIKRPIYRKVPMNFSHLRIHLGLSSWSKWLRIHLPRANAGDMGSNPGSGRFHMPRGN